MIFVHHISGKDDQIRLAIVDRLNESGFCFSKFFQMKVRQLDNAEAVKGSRDFRAGIIVICSLKPGIQTENDKKSHSYS